MVSIAAGYSYTYNCRFPFVTSVEILATKITVHDCVFRNVVTGSCFHSNSKPCIGWYVTISSLTVHCRSCYTVADDLVFKDDFESGDLLQKNW